MPGCDGYNPDNVFKRFKVLEFPTSFVGLSTSQELDVELDLESSAFLKTMYEGHLWIVDKAREVSASHRAFNISRIDGHTINITFKPLSECISRVKKYMKNFDNRFVFDLRLIKVDGTRCCNNEFHSEIGRYYICGQYEYCNISHQPKILNFGNVHLNTKATKYIRLKNESKLVPAKIFNVRTSGFQVTPKQFVIPPNSSKRISVTLKPTSLRQGKTLVFKIRNPHDIYEEPEFMEETVTDSNFISYAITTECKVIYKPFRKAVEIESLHKLCEPSPFYTYLNKELVEHEKRKAIAHKIYTISKADHVKQHVVEKFSTGKEICYPDLSPKINVPGEDFCKKKQAKVATHELLDILILPFSVDFGRIGLQTYGEQNLNVKNNTKYEILIKLLPDQFVCYTQAKLKQVDLKMKAFSETTVTISCHGLLEGNFGGTFAYVIDNRYYRKHPYRLQVGNPTLVIHDHYLKFGMVTTDGFVTSVPVRIYNNFNESVNYRWEDIHQDMPFEIIPKCGTVPKHSCRICDVIYVCKGTKSKNHELDLFSEGPVTKVIPLEFMVMTRKLSIKFLQQAVLFKDIALNIETIEKVKLENSSREIALFHVVEPLIPGLRIEPMSGIIRPKIVMTLDIIVKISCILEFAFDVYVKINNKENVVLPISGNVVEPKLIIHPKNIYMARIPCGMITYVPVTFQNLSSLRVTVEVIDTGDENIFNVYIPNGNEKQRVLEFNVDGGQNKTVYIKVFDIFRREYEMYIPFKVNGLLGPPNNDSWSTELQHYIGHYEQFYEGNPKVKVKSVNKDISYCRVTGVITVPWIQFSVDKFEIVYVPNGKNCINFTMTNVSKYYLHVTIFTSKLAPSFSLDLSTEENQSIINETLIRFELNRGKEASFCLKFHPKGHGRFVTVAVLFLDKYMTLPYFNMTFIGKRQTPAMTPSTHRIIFPPCLVGKEISRNVTLKMEAEAELDSFTCSSKEEPNLIVTFLDCEVYPDGEEFYSIITIKITVSCKVAYSRNLTLNFNHEGGSCCELETNFCFTYCPLTLHTTLFVKPEENPYPYFPLSSQAELYDYLEECSSFLEKWMFQQGFRRDLFPIIPDTFHAISSAMSTQIGSKSSKGINVSYLNFVKRIAGPLMKHIHKVSLVGVDESFRGVKEIHDTYKEIIYLLKSRGANLWVLQAKFLLSYNQFVTLVKNFTPKCNADIILLEELVTDVNLFNRLNKQSWIDFILQSYKVFVMDSCFFDCVCVSSQPRDITKVLIDWYNEHIAMQHQKLRGNDKPVKVVTNLTIDLSDGIAIISSFLNHCPFLKEHFSLYCEVNDDDREAVVINNGCLIIEAINMLRLYFPLNSTDLMKPNFLQMLFLSIHLYVTLPMFKTKDVVNFNPPLLRTSTRQLAISATSQESLLFNQIILNNKRNNFMVEKSPSGDNGKKMFISVKYTANFVAEESCILLVHGYNKTRIFDTYIIFELVGCIGSLTPIKKCKVTGPLYRPNKVDILVSSPFPTTAIFNVYLTDNEPSIPVEFEEHDKNRFYVRRLNLIDKEIFLNGLPKELGQELLEHKLYLLMICLSTQVGNSWIWFRSEVGEFFMRITTQPRWDLAVDTLQAKVQTWPMDPCSCGEACECYRTTVLMIPHRNDLMLKSLRYALLEHASDVMMQIYDHLIETTTGKIILGMLLIEGGTNISEVNHILRRDNTYRVTSRTLLPRLDRVTLAQHTDAVLALPITVPPNDKSEKYAVTFTSDCGMDIRNYRILFIETAN